MGERSFFVSILGLMGHVTNIIPSLTMKKKVAHIHIYIDSYMYIYKYTYTYTYTYVTMYI